MPDSLGPIEIPEPLTIDDFPLKPDYGSGQEISDRIVAHLMDQPGLRTEQRFYVGDGARRFRVRKDHLSCTEYDDLKAHWQDASGVEAEFFYDHPTSQTTFERVKVRYAEPQLLFDHVAAFVTGEIGIMLQEVPQSTPLVDIGKVLIRFPDAPFTAELLHQVQRVIPLIVIEGRGVDQEPLYISDRRIRVTGLGGTEERVYLPRLLEWSGISQSIGENSDQAQFTFGNADGIWYDYTNQLSLSRATISFGLLFLDQWDAEIGTLVDLWRGYVYAQSFRETNDSFQIAGFDGVYELNLMYPTRQLSRRCQKRFADGVWCPYSDTHIDPDTGTTKPGFVDCMKSYENCKERGMQLHFGGVKAPAQDVKIKNAISGIQSHGRSAITSVTVSDDTIYQRLIPEVYIDNIRVAGTVEEHHIELTGEGMPMECIVAAGIDEDEYYSAIGIVSEGPIASFHEDFLRHSLDGVGPHDPQKSGGFRGVPGRDPADRHVEFFGTNIFPWSWPGESPTIPPDTPYPPGSSFAAGTAFAEIRRTDVKGLQLSKISERKMVVNVTGGMGGWVWLADEVAEGEDQTYTRTWRQTITNPVWITVNMYLRAFGMKTDPSHTDHVTIEQQEALFDVPAAFDAAKIAEDVVNKVPGVSDDGIEIQFPFYGILREQKPVRDWMQEVLNTCLGYYTFVTGKLRIGIRVNSSVPVGGAFTIANVLRRSVQSTFVEPGFNHITIEFGDEEFEWQLNNVQWYDVEHAQFIGGDLTPKYLPARMSLVGVSNKSQASRIAITRLREEVGGTTRQEQMDARHISLRTTVMALSIYPGQICSLNHDKLPNGRVEFRVQSWKLNPDWTIDIQGTSTCDSMYNYVIGPKPEDVLADPVPPERRPSAHGIAWLPNEVAPFADDPVWLETELTFKVWQDANIEAEGTYAGVVMVQGEECINRFLEGKPPAIRNLKKFTTGGLLPGGQSYYFAVAQRNELEDGSFVLLSNYTGVWIPEGSETNMVTLAPIRSRQDMPGWSYWAGTDIRVMSQQAEFRDGPLPATLDITGPLTVRTRGIPEFNISRIRIKCREVYHSGVAGIQVMRVEAPNRIYTSELFGSNDDWYGQILSVVADASDLSVPLWNFRITGFASGPNPEDAHFEVTPDCIRTTDTGTVIEEDSVAEGDVMIVRSRATSADETTITNTLWANDVGAAQSGAVDGLDPEVEIGLTIMIIHGTGKGQIRRITHNGNLTHTVFPPWTTIPDTTSIYIVTQSDWPYSADSIEHEVKQEDERVVIACRITNSVDHVILVGGFLVDNLGRETFEFLAAYREIYVFGEPYQVRTTTLSDDHADVYDQTIRVDTTEGDVVVNLPDVKQYFGRKLLVVNDGTGDTPGRAIVVTIGDDEFQTDTDEIILEKPGDWAEFLAAGDREETIPVTLKRHTSVWTQQRRRRVAHPAWKHSPGQAPMSPPKRRGNL